MTSNTMQTHFNPISRLKFTLLSIFISFFSNFHLQTFYIKKLINLKLIDLVVFNLRYVMNFQFLVILMQN